MVEIFVCQLPEKRSQTELRALLTHIPLEKQKRILYFFHLDDAYRTLIGYFLIQCIFYKRTGSRLKDVRIEENAYGKPNFPEYPSIQYNVSHSGDFVVCAVHDQPVGIDIEEVNPFDLQLAKQLFTGSEYLHICEAENTDHAFYDIWTIKESYVKALGKGLSLPLNSFRVKKIDADEIELTDLDTYEEIRDYMCKQYKIDEGYKLSVCAYRAGKKGFIERPHQVPFDILCDNVLGQHL